MKVCINCGVDFNSRHPRHKLGKVNECGDCHTEGHTKSIGVLVVDGKTDYHIEVISNPTTQQCKTVKRAGKCGPTQCHTSLGLSTNGANTPKDKMDSVQSKLYGE